MQSGDNSAENLSSHEIDLYIVNILEVDKRFIVILILSPLVECCTGSRINYQFIKL